MDLRYDRRRRRSRSGEERKQFIGRMVNITYEFVLINGDVSLSISTRMSLPPENLLEE